MMISNGASGSLGLAYFKKEMPKYILGIVAIRQGIPDEK